MNKTIATETKSKTPHYAATDSVIDRCCNRKVSAIITRIIVKTQITANQVTIFNVFVGIIAMFFFQKGGYYNFIIGSLVYQLNTVLDHCDGEIARLKNQSSRFGFWLDLITDAFVGSAIVISIGLGLSKSLNNDSYIIWGFLSGGGIALSSFLVFYNASKRGGKVDTICCFSDSKDGKPPTALENFIDKTLNKNLSFYILIGAIVGKLNLLLIVSAIGVQIHWILILIVICKKRWLKS